jgi:hypothetical protein
VKYFDYESVAREAKIPEEKLRKLVNLIQQEFPHDAMMAESPYAATLPSRTRRSHPDR